MNEFLLLWLNEPSYGFTSAKQVQCQLEERALVRARAWLICYFERSRTSSLFYSPDLDIVRLKDINV